MVEFLEHSSCPALLLLILRLHALAAAMVDFSYVVFELQLINFYFSNYEMIIVVKWCRLMASQRYVCVKQ